MQEIVFALSWECRMWILVLKRLIENRNSDLLELYLYINCNSTLNYLSHTFPVFCYHYCQYIIININITVKLTNLSYSQNVILRQFTHQNCKRDLVGYKPDRCDIDSKDFFVKAEQEPDFVEVNLFMQLALFLVPAPVQEKRILMQQIHAIRNTNYPLIQCLIGFSPFTYPWRSFNLQTSYLSETTRGGA